MPHAPSSAPAYADLLRILDAAIRDGVWRDLDAHGMQSLVGAQRDAGSLRLFTSIDAMRVAHEQVRLAGFAEIPDFGIARGRRDESTIADPRLFLDDVLFIGGSRTAGDDELLAVDVSPLRPGLRVLFSDWTAPLSERWAKLGTLRDVLAQLRGST